MIAAMTREPTLRVPFRAFDIESPWEITEDAASAELVGVERGDTPRLATRVFLFRDAGNLYSLFSMEDERKYVATYLERDEPIYDEDVLEIFIAPERISLYYEFEVSPLATLFDARVASPELDRRSMDVDRKWDCPGLWAAVRRMTVRDRTTADTLLVIPLAPLGLSADAGTSFRANFFRVDRGEQDEFSAWCPTLRTPPDFHVPTSFGRILFV